MAETSPRRASRNSLTPSFWFGEIDTLPLGIFRFILGAMLVWWYVDLLPDATAFYSDQGYLPRSAALSGLASPDHVSLMTMVGTSWGVVSFLLAGALAAFCLMIGYRSRLAAAACFVFIYSVQERNVLHLDGSDDVFRLVCFWMIFCPLDRVWSVDSLLATARHAPLSRWAPAFPVRILQLQIALVYTINCWNKTLGTKWENGTALYYALHLEHFLVRDLGTWMADVGWFTRAGTYGTLVFEGTFPILVFFPFFQPYLKAFGLLAGTGFHLGIALLMKVGWFSYLMPTTYLVFFEAEWIEKPLEWLEKRIGPPRAFLFYDGRSPLATGVVRVLERLDLLGRLDFLDFRDRDVLEANPRMRRYRLVRRVHLRLGTDESDRVTEGFRAIVLAAMRLPATALVAPLGLVPGISQLGRAVWERAVDRTPLVADDRDPAGDHLAFEPAMSVEVPMLRPAPRSPRLSVSPSATVVSQTSEQPLVSPLLTSVARWVGRAGLATLFFLVAWNATPEGVQRNLPVPVSQVLETGGLWQNWTMFAPEPLAWQMHLEIVGKLEDGSEVNLLGLGYGQGGFNPTQPYYDGWYYSRWMKVAERIMNDTYEPWRLEYGRSICRAYNGSLSSGQSQLMTFQIYRVQREIPPPGQPWSDWEKVLIWDHHCF